MRGVLEADVYDRGNVRMAQILGSDIAMAHWRGLFTAHPRRSVSITTRLLYSLMVKEGLMWPGLRGGGLWTGARRGRIAIEVIGVDPRLRDLWLPVANRIGCERCVLVLSHGALRSGVPAEFPVVVFDDMKGDWPHCRRWIVKRIPRWLRELKGLCSDGHLATTAHLELTSIVVHQVIRLAKALRLANVVSACAFLSLWDQGNIGAPLCAAFGACGVPTYTMVHGAIGSLSMAEFVPLVADYVFVWGETQEELFRKSGVSEDRIIRVGYQRGRRVLPSAESCAKIIEGLELAGTGPLVTIAFTTLRHDEREVWASAVRRLNKALPEGRFLCRLHPSSVIAEFAGLLPQGRRLRLAQSRAASVAATLAISDAVIVDSSTFGFEALLHGKIVGILDCYDTAKPQDVMFDAIVAGAVLYDRSPESLAAQPRRTWTDPAARNALLKRAAEFTARYVVDQGEAATERIASVLLSRLG